MVCNKSLLTLVLAAAVAGVGGFSGIISVTTSTHPSLFRHPLSDCAPPAARCYPLEHDARRATKSPLFVSLVRSEEPPRQESLPLRSRLVSSIRRYSRAVLSHRVARFLLLWAVLFVGGMMLPRPAGATTTSSYNLLRRWIGVPAEATLAEAAVDSAAAVTAGTAGAAASATTRSVRVPAALLLLLLAAITGAIVGKKLKPAPEEGLLRLGRKDSSKPVELAQVQEAEELVSEVDVDSSLSYEDAEAAERERLRLAGESLLEQALVRLQNTAIPTSAVKPVPRFENSPTTSPPQTLVATPAIPPPPAAPEKKKEPELPPPPVVVESVVAEPKVEVPPPAPVVPPPKPAPKPKPAVVAKIETPPEPKVEVPPSPPPAPKVEVPPVAASVAVSVEVPDTAAPTVKADTNEEEDADDDDDVTVEEPTSELAAAETEVYDDDDEGKVILSSKDELERRAKRRTAGDSILQKTLVRFQNTAIHTDTVNPVVVDDSSETDDDDDDDPLVGAIARVDEQMKEAEEIRKRIRKMNDDFYFATKQAIAEAGSSADAVTAAANPPTEKKDEVLTTAADITSKESDDDDDDDEETQGGLISKVAGGAVKAASAVGTATTGVAAAAVALVKKTDEEAEAKKEELAKMELQVEYMKTTEEERLAARKQYEKERKELLGDVAMIAAGVVAVSTVVPAMMGY